MKRWSHALILSSAFAAGIAVGVSGRTTSNQQPGSTTNDQRPTSNDQTLPRATFPGVVALLKDPSKALAALDREMAGRGESAPIEGFVLRAHLLSDLRRYEQSVAAWDDVARRDSALREFCERAAIADLLAARDLGAAAPRIDKLVGPRPQRDDDLLLVSLAEAYQATGQTAAAAEIYRGVVARERDTILADRARLGLAKSEEGAGHLDAAQTALHQATITWRLPDTFATARSEERRVAAASGREATPLSADQYFTVAARLTSTSSFDDAVALLEAAVKAHQLPDDDKLEATIIVNLYRGRHNDAAMTRASRFLTRFPASRSVADVRLIQLRLDIRMGNIGQARTRLASLLGDRRVPLGDRQSAQRLVAANLVAAGTPRDGLALYRQLLKSRLPRADRFDVSWRAGIAAIRAGDMRAASDLLTQARKSAAARSSPRSTLYWIGVIRDRSGQSPEARRIWTDLVADNAYDYYGIRAAERLSAAGAAPPSPTVVTFPPITIGENATASPEFQTAIALGRAGLLEESSSMFGAAMTRFRRDSGLALLAARAATAAGSYATAASLVSTRFGQCLEQPCSGMPDDVWQMAFPKAYWNEVEGAASRNTVDPLLLLSLMRRESRFVATARSRTGAMGLFQIMPYTAREIVPVTEEARESDSLLHAPTSADLAARLVKRILGRFNGATAPVVAAYNAGEDRVEDWWKAGVRLPEDLFVDSIPYGETRQYVREVLANYATYRRLYGSR